MSSRPIQFLFDLEARSYFTNLVKSSSTGDFKIKLQQYWLCCQIGIKFDKKGKVPEPKGNWLVDNFAPPLAEHADFIRSVVFWRYADALGVDPEDREDMIPQLRMFFDENKQTKLGDAGMNLMDAYAAGGFEILQERIPNPTDLSSFLIDYVALLTSETA